MFGLRRGRSAPDPIEGLHEAVVAASREAELYGEDRLPDTVEGRFESLTLHLLVVLRRLRSLPAPAGDVAQDLVDLAFSRLEVALRESGVGDFGVPKRMKALASAFYDRTAGYDVAIAASDEEALADAIARRLPGGQDRYRASARHILTVERDLAGLALDGLLAGRPFATSDRGGER